MIRVLPYPDELVNGHEGRAALVNGHLSTTTYLKALREILPDSHRSSRDFPRLHVMAAMCNMDLDDYANMHSMFPVMRVSYRSSLSSEQTGPGSKNYAFKIGTSTPRENKALFCKHCVASDLANIGIAWYRRIHHLAGVDWCMIHGAPLLEVSASRPYERPPNHWHRLERFTNLTSYPEPFPTQGILDRFVQISMALLRRKKAVRSDILNRVILERIKDCGYRIGAIGTRPFLSDFLRTELPSWWQKEHVPILLTTAPGRYASTIDNIASRFDVPCTGFTYALALASLYQTTGDGLAALKWADKLASSSQNFGALDKKIPRSRRPTLKL